MIDIAAAISSTSTLLGIAKGAIAARDEAKAQQALTEVQLKLSEVTMAALSMSQANIALTDEIRLLKDEAYEAQLKTRHREAYALAEITPGAQAYKAKPTEEGTDMPPHYLCQPCYDKGVKSMLRQKRSHYGTTFWSCPEEKDHEIYAQRTHQ